jgi:uncharacterized protein YjbJ (UPF0337 family)
MGEIIDKIKGKAKQVEGNITGNRARKAEGVADETKGRVKGAFEKIKIDVKRVFGNHSNPSTSGGRRSRGYASQR